MSCRRNLVKPLIVAVMLPQLGAAYAASPASLLAALEAEAELQAGTPMRSSPARGEALFNTRRADWSCASCHTSDPRREGSHVVTGKPIKPMAPAANPNRFTDRAKTDKWFRRNCQDVLGRACTAAEQADVVAYLLSLRT